MEYNNVFLQLISHNLPDAMARVHGNSAHPGLNGIVKFYDTPFGGIVIEAEFAGLPDLNENVPEFLGFHIHENGDCSDDFNNTGNHFNPTNAIHPHHLGDLPPLLNNNGYAYTLFYNDFLNIGQIMGRSVIVHNNRDDFTSQPSGDSGTKIGCGVIEKY